MLGGNDRGLTVKMAGSSAGLDLPWERLSLNDLAILGRACITGDATRALTVGENCIAFDLMPMADEVLHLAARLNPKLSSEVAQRLAAIPPR